jgi:hypothetical protein
MDVRLDIWRGMFPLTVNKIHIDIDFVEKFCMIAVVSLLPARSAS